MAHFKSLEYKDISLFSEEISPHADRPWASASDAGETNAHAFNFGPKHRDVFVRNAIIAIRGFDRNKPKSASFEELYRVMTPDFGRDGDSAAAIFEAMETTEYLDVDEDGNPVSTGEHVFDTEPEHVLDSELDSEPARNDSSASRAAAAPTVYIIHSGVTELN